MFKFLENLRSKSKDQKRAISFGVSLSLTAVIFVGWASLSYAKFSGDLSSSKLPSLATPIAAIKENFSQTFDKEKFGSIEDIISSTTIKNAIVDLSSGEALAE